LAEVVGILNILAAKDYCIVCPKVLMDPKIAEESSLCYRSSFSSFPIREWGKKMLEEEIFLC